MSDHRRPWRGRQPKREKFKWPKPDRYSPRRQNPPEVKELPDLEIDRNWGNVDPDAQRP